MPTFDMTPDDWFLLGLAVVLVILPSRVSSIGNLVGRLIKGRPAGS